jgi:hypothetical protein
MKNVEELLIAGGSDEGLRSKYDALKSMEDFVAMAGNDAYDFTTGHLEEVLREYLATQPNE